MSFAEVVWCNLTRRWVRSALTAAAVAIGIMMVVALGVLTHSLRQTAVSILRTGEADFTIAQRGLSDVLRSAVDEKEVVEIGRYEGVEAAIGVFIAAVRLDERHPFFLELGVPVENLEEFGVQVVQGRAYAPTAEDELMLGYRAARDLGKTVGSTIDIDGEFTVVGIYSTGQPFGDAASMMPLATLQARERRPGIVTLVFVRVAEGTDIDRLRARIERDFPHLATVRTEAEFGRIDRNLDLISAANLGVTIVSLVIGAISVSNTVMMSVFERTREFGVLRAIGWSRRRVLALVLLEAVAVSLVGAMLGTALGYVIVRVLQELPDLVGVFQPDFTAAVFGRALGIAVGMAFAGAIYPALRAASLPPLEALRHE